MRIYLPALAADLSKPSISPRRAYALTAELRQAFPEEDQDTLEAYAHIYAAQFSLQMLLQTVPGVDRRIVIAADAPEDLLHPLAGQELPGSVEVVGEIAWSEVVALFVDEAAIEPDIALARRGDEAALLRVNAADLLWYDVCEREMLISELKISSADGVGK